MEPHRHLRGPRPRPDHAAPRRARGTAGNLCRDGASRRHRLPARPRRHVRRAAAGAPLRVRAGRCLRGVLSNYWGYNSIGFFAPHAAYSSSGSRGEQVTEFKQMVKDLHAAGLEVILDVVYNHTAEGGVDRPGAGLPRVRRRLVLPKRRVGPVRRRDRLRQHGARRRAPGAATGDGLAALLGQRDARRRLPLRPGVGAGPQRLAVSTCTGPSSTRSAKTRCCATSS